MSYGQDKGVDNFLFENQNRIYRTLDTVRISYALDSIEILYSNFGGCGWDAVYKVVCHSDSRLTRIPQPSCDYGLMEYGYVEEGSLDIIMDTPGIYSVVFFVKRQDQKEVQENHFTQTLSTPKFTVIYKKKIKTSTFTVEF